MAVVPTQRPAGVGAYTRAPQPTTSPDDHVQPLEDKPLPPGAPAPPAPRLGRKARAILALGVALVVVLGAVGILAFVVPAQYPQQQYLTLNSAQGWWQSYCIPVQPGGPSTTNVSLSWSTSDSSRVTFLVWPTFVSGPNPFSPFPPLNNQTVFNGTGASGSGWYVSEHGPDATENLGVIGVQNPSVSVQVTLSYDLPGHYLGGPTTAATCSP